MLVVGSRGNGAFAAMILGSVSRYAATHAACPVVVVREAAESSRRQVGIGIGDLENSASLTFAFEEAALRKASLIAVHSWHLPDSDVSRAGPAFDEPSRYVAETETAKRLEQVVDGWRAKYPDVPVSQDLVHGHPGRALVGLSARADLVVLGRRSAHHGPASVMHAVLSHAHGPVVTVPSAPSSRTVRDAADRLVLPARRRDRRQGRPGQLLRGRLLWRVSPARASRWSAAARR